MYNSVRPVVGHMADLSNDSRIRSLVPDAHRRNFMLEVVDVGGEERWGRLLETTEGPKMPAYVILTQERTIDPTELETYARLAPIAGKGHPVKRLAHHGNITLLEGDPIELAVVLEFPSAAAAQEWYDSPAYQEALVHRKAGADSRVFIIDGVA